MRTDVACDKLCDIVPFISDIAEKAREDEALKKTMVDGVGAKTLAEQIRFISGLVKKCKVEVLSILGVWYDKSYDEIAEQDFFAVTLPMVKELLNNADIKSFFGYASSTEQAEQTVEDEAEDVSLPTSESTAAETEQESAPLNPYSGI